MVRWQATATWLAAATALGALGCGRRSDVVATISRESVQPTGGSAGAGMGGRAGGAGAIGAGSGGSGGSGTGAVGTGTGAGGRSGSGGSLGSEPPPIADGGMPPEATDGGDAGALCPVANRYAEVIAYVESDCLITPAVSPALFWWSFSLAPVAPMGETRMIAMCEVVNSRLDAVYDDKNRNAVIGVRLCINLCDAVRKSVAMAREQNPCLDEVFPPSPDAGTGS